MHMLLCEPVDAWHFGLRSSPEDSPELHAGP